MTARKKTQKNADAGPPRAAFGIQCLMDKTQDKTRDMTRNPVRNMVHDMKRIARSGGIGYQAASVSLIGVIMVTGWSFFLRDISLNASRLPGISTR